MQAKTSDAVVQELGLALLDGLVMKGIVGAALAFDVTVARVSRRHKKRDTIQKEHDHVTLF